MAVVALDANAFLYPVQFDIRLFEELERLFGQPRLLTPGAVLDELQALRSGGGSDAIAANVGLDLARDRTEIVETRASNGDDALVELATSGRITHVVTSDKALQSRLHELGISTVILRGETHLVCLEP